MGSREGYLACASGFSDAAIVLDRASLTFLRYLGERGRHARAITMVNELPMTSPLELVVTFAITPS